MKERLKEIVSNYSDPVLKLNKGREYLQELILFLLYKNKLSSSLIFEGGTALRLVYGLKRFSEDLDFSAIKKIDYELSRKKIEKELTLMNYSCEVKVKESKSLVMLNVKFKDVYMLLNLPFKKYLSIYIEIDKNPPKGGEKELTIVGKEFFSRIYHYDLSSLFSKKLHALFFRKYEKGRDYYDLIWFIKRKTEPNIELLIEATLQTNPEKVEELKKIGWKNFLVKKIENSNFKKIREDVKPFLENIEELNILNKNDILNLLQIYSA